MRVRSRATSRIGNANEIQHLECLFHGLFLTDLLVQYDGLLDLIPAREHGVETRHRLLEDHGDLIATNCSHLTLGEIEQVPSLVDDFTAVNKMMLLR